MEEVQMCLEEANVELVEDTEVIHGFVLLNPQLTIGSCFGLRAGQDRLQVTLCKITEICVTLMGNTRYVFIFSRLLLLYRTFYH